MIFVSNVLNEIDQEHLLNCSTFKTSTFIAAVLDAKFKSADMNVFRLLHLIVLI